MKKRVLLAFVLLMTFFVGAWAESLKFRVCYTSITDDNKDDIIAAISEKAGVTVTGDGTMSYDSETGVLSMNNVDISYDTSLNNDGLIFSCYLEKDLIIDVTGDCKLTTNADNGCIYMYSYSLKSNLIIRGSGSLTLTTTRENGKAVTYQGESLGVTIDNTTLTVNGSLYGFALSTLTIINSTVRAGKICEFTDVILDHASIQEPVGAVVTKGVRLNGVYVNDVVIVPDNRKDGELSWSSTGNYYWKYGQEPPAVYTFKNPHALAVTFSSSNEELATVDDQGNVTLIKPGLVYISAYFAGNSEYMTQGVGWLIVGNKGYVNMSFAQTDCKAALGQTMNSPEVLFKDYETGEVVTGQKVTYSSKDESIATVDPETGVVTPVAEGQTKIVASFVKNDFYNAYKSPIEYTLTVKQPGVTTLAFPQETYYAQMGSVFTVPTLTNDDNVPVTYSSSDETVAEVDATTGAVTIKKAGETTITATFAGNADFLATSASYKLIVQKISAAIAFPKLEYTYVMSTSPFDAPTVQTTPEGLSVTYSSSNQTVAKVNATTGAVEILKPGETTIMATFAGNDIYNEVSGSYKLIVSFVKGDADGDGAIDVNDVTTTINHILGKPVANFVYEAANIDGDDTIDVNDVQGIIDRALGKVTE